MGAILPHQAAVVLPVAGLAGRDGPGQGRGPIRVECAGCGQTGACGDRVTAICADGTVCQAIVETTGRVDADWWEQRAASAHLEVPPPYRPEPGQPVYEVRAAGRVTQVAEGDLAGPLRELVTAVLAEGGHGE
jgi:hypothetical protein